MPAETNNLRGCHIHFGPGKLGLGLVAAISSKAGLDLHLIGRVDSQPDLSPGYTLRVRGIGGIERDENVTITSFSKADCWDHLDPKVQAALIEAPELLLTTSVTTKGLSARQHFVLDLVRRRKASPHAQSTIFIAAENDTGPNYPKLAHELGALGVDCRRTVVDRLCTQTHIDPITGIYVVTVDELAQWIIEGDPSTSRTLGALAQSSFVWFVPDFEPFEVRKRWLVNGVHLALAITAHARPMPSIDITLAADTNLEWTTRLERTLIQVFDHRYPDLHSSLDYAISHLPGWLRNPDPVTRILSRLKRTDLLPFFEDFDSKLGDALSDPFIAKTGPTDEARETFDALQAILVKHTSYVDFGDPQLRKGPLSLSQDRQALKRYQDLLNGIFDSGQAAKRVKALSIAFNRHYDYYNV